MAALLSALSSTPDPGLSHGEGSLSGDAPPGKNITPLLPDDGSDGGGDTLVVNQEPSLPIPSLPKPPYFIDESSFTNSASSKSNSALSISLSSISDRWAILEKVGEGGMSSVYKARHHIMNKIVAVKVLHPHLAIKSISVKRFQQEAKAAGSLSHPNVVSVYDCGISEDGHPFLIMDYVDGPTLSELIKKRGPLDPKAALELFMQTCAAVQHAHEHGIIHRDLKPSNVMVVSASEGDQAKVLDFGIAKLLENESEECAHLTQTGDVFGSPLYMSPEQCSGSKLDARSDIYSMGCLMYEALTGKPPFMGLNLLETMHRQINEAPQALISAKAPDSLLKRLNVIVLRCLEKNPSERFQSMKDLHNELAIALSSAETLWLKRTITSKASALLRRHQRFLRSTLPVTALVLFVLASAFYFAAPWFLRKSEVVSAEQMQKPIWTAVEIYPKYEAPYKNDPDFSSKERQARAGLWMTASTAGEASEEFAITETALAQFYMVHGALPAAIECFGTASRIREKAPDGDKVAELSTLAKMAECQYQIGQLAASAHTWTIIYSKVLVLRGVQISYANDPLEHLVVLYSEMGNLRGARLAATAYLNTMGSANEDEERHAQILTIYSDVLRRQKDYVQAKAGFTKALQLWHNLKQKPSLEEARCWLGMGLCDLATDDYGAAVQALQRALINASGDDKGNTLIRSIKKLYRSALWRSDTGKALMYTFNPDGADQN